MMVEWRLVLSFLFLLARCSVTTQQPQCGVGRDVEGLDRSLIANGRKAEKNEWPWMAALLYEEKLLCGGSLIDLNHVLTAAHCVSWLDPKDRVTSVRLGAHHIKQQQEKGVHESKIADVSIHPGFNRSGFQWDAAIITLETPVPGDLSTVRPVCLPSCSPQRWWGNPYAGIQAIFAGWGMQSGSYPRSYPNELMEAGVKVWDDRTCERNSLFFKSSKMLCTRPGVLSVGDTGGPLVARSRTGEWTQIGVSMGGHFRRPALYTSFRRPALYTSVVAIKGWIDKIVRDH